MRPRLAATIFSVAAVVLALSMSGSARDSTDTDKVEYKIISARQFGITIRPDGDSVFNYEEAAETLNTLADKGWRYRDFLPIGGNAAFVLERQR